jgi:hypothetical protein
MSQHYSRYALVDRKGIVRAIGLQPQASKKLGSALNRSTIRRSVFAPPVSSRCLPTALFPMGARRSGAFVPSDAWLTGILQM